MVSFNVWAAVRTLKGSLGSGVGYRIAQRLNPLITEEEWRDALAEARAILRNRVDELSRPLSRRPIAEEIRDFPVKNPGGWIQQVEIFIRDTGTGLIDVRHYSYRTDTLRSRANVIKEVRQIFADTISEKPDEYPEEVIGAAYVGTHALVPRAE